MSSKAETFFSSSGAILYVTWRATSPYQLVDISESVQHSLGWEASQLLKDGALFASIFHAKERVLVNEDFDQLIDTKRVGPFHHKPMRLRSSMGIWRWHAMVSEIEYEDGKPQSIHSAITDIHEQNLRTLELRESEKRLELVLEGTRLGMWDWYPQTNDVRFNDRWAEMLGYHIDEIEMNLNTWESKVHPEDLAACYADITAHMEGKVPFYENIHRMKHKDGSWKYILDRGKIVERDDSGNPIRFTGTHTDITAQKVAEQKALDASRAKGKFLAHMSHEIRTPLNGVIGMADVLADLDLSDDQWQALRVLKESGTHLQSVLNDILDYSKIEEGELSFDNEVFSLTNLVQNAISLFSEKARDKGIALKVTIADGVNDTRIGDTTRIRQVLFNLISNALKFTSEGFVDMQIDAKGDTLLFNVVDSGIGIEDTSGIFDRFKQADSSITKRFGGTGLGLAITSRLIEMMQGTISVSSRPGHGSTFTFDIHAPVSKQEMQKARSESELSSKAKQLRVLVAEDNPTNQLVIEKSLEFLGVSCDIVENGKLAVEAVTSKEYDIVLMDLHMPVMGGYEAAQLIREYKNENGAVKPAIIALTADVVQETREQCLVAGMTKMLGKPFQRKQLIEMLNESAD